MKKYIKNDFIKYLQGISLLLDKAEIKHEIPFCHIDKMEWNYINIIIPDFITSYDISNILNPSNIKEKESIIYVDLDGFDIRFIKTRDDLWVYTLYYYSWDILHILMNILTLDFNLSYERTGLYYKYNDKKIFITKNLKDVYDFFDLPFHLITNGFPTEHSIYNFIYNASYYSKLLFTKDSFKKIDYYYENNLSYYNEFLDNLMDIEIKTKTIEEKIALIDAFFPKSSFLEKLSRIQLKEEYPNLRENDIKTPHKNMEDILSEKEQEVIKLKKKKKINLSKYFKKKDKPGNDDYRLSD